MKRKLLMAALFVVSAFGFNAKAQTNIIADWDGGNNTGKPTEFGWSSSYSKRSWGTLNGSGARVTNNYAGYKLENGESYTYIADSEPSTQILWLRYNNNGQTEKYTYEFDGLKPLHCYNFSGLVGWHNNDGKPTFTITVNGDTEFGRSSKESITARQVLYPLTFDFMVPADDESETFELQFTCAYNKNENGGSSHDCMEALSALSITLDIPATIEVMKKFLNSQIQHATNINEKLSEDIDFSAEQATFNKNEESEVYITELEGAINSLKSKINTAIKEYEFNPAGDDVTAFYILNNGFDEEINFNSSSSVNTVAATVYPTLGWTSSVGGNCTAATIGYGYEGVINGNGNVKAPSTNYNSTTDGGSLVMCVGWSGTVTYKNIPVTLKEGSYKITYKTYNGNIKNTNAVEAIPLVGFVPTEGTSNICNEIQTFKNQVWEEHSYSFELDADTEGKLQIGLKPTTNTFSYNAPELFVDEITITYSSPLAAAKTELKSLLSTANGIDPNSLNTATKDKLTAAISTANDALGSTEVETVKNAFSGLDDAVSIANSMIEPYARFNAYKSIIANSIETVDGAKETFSDVISEYEELIENATTVADIEQYLAVIETARQEYVVKAYPTNETTFDYTFFIKNAKIANTDSWNNGRVNSGEQYHGAPDNTYLDTYDETRNVAQDLSGLPAGVYVLRAATRGLSTLGTANIYVMQNGANLNSTDVHKDGNTGGELGNGWGWTEVEFTLPTSGDVRIGFYSECGGRKWAGADNFTLTLMRDLNDEEKTTEAKKILSNTISTANGLNKTINIGDGAFQIPTSAVNTINAAIEEAQGVYDAASVSLTQVTNATIALSTAITAYKNVELNAPKSEVAYKIYQPNGFSFTKDNVDYNVVEGAPITFVEGGNTEADGSFGITWEHADNVNYAQALSFTKVEGNLYKISFVDATNTTRYIATQKGAGYMDVGNISTRTDRLRVTTDAEKALKVEVIPTTTDGLFNFKNTEHGSLIGGTDFGVFTTNSNAALAVKVAEEAKVTFNSEDGGFYTLMLPFAAELPTGMKAYTCDKVDGNVLALTDAESFAPNTPYIVEGGKGEHKFSGYGLATKVSYEGGLLTGVYADTKVPAGSYVLQEKDGNVKFYRVSEEEDMQPTLKPYRAYLTVGNAAGVKAFSFGGETTGINGVETLTDGAVESIYTISGTRVNSLQKGLNIVKMSNGKTQKVLVK